MIHPDTELRFINPEIGFGVFATALIPLGTVTWVADPLDRALSPAEIAALPANLRENFERYTWLARDGRAILTWDLARYVNHSCAPNSLTTEYGFEIAARNIAAGEELCNDYADLGLRRHEDFECYCDAPNCRGTVRAVDSENLRSHWNRLAVEALAAMGDVIQPLDSLLQANTPQQRTRAIRRFG